MPTYEYECVHCAHVFEKFQSIKDKPLVRCPKCRHKLRKLVGSGAGIIFKGTGFYETDYRRPRKPGNEEGGSKTTEGKKDSSGKGGE